MSIERLQKKFDESLTEFSKLDVFRRLYLETLFEINSNLSAIVEVSRRTDTAIRAVVDVLDRERQDRLKREEETAKGKSKK